MNTGLTFFLHFFVDAGEKQLSEKLDRASQ